MKNIKSILLSLAMVALGVNTVNAQCCNVVSTNGVNAITANGICATTADGLAGDCGDMKSSTTPAIIDTDGDGVADAEDKCPKIAGLSSLMGCPDFDKDGVADADDKCPAVAGIAANKGCPAISEEVKATLLKAANIQFATGSDVILAESYPNLDAVVLIMESNPAYKLELSGYTDNTGDPNYNLDLSKKRAASAKMYLINKGVDVSRITSDGYGIASPIATNDTPEGRKKNRRVEFNIKF